MNVWRHSGALLSAGLLAPLGAAALTLRPDWRAGWQERLGAGERPDAGSIWVHGASVGEILSVSRLIDRLLGAGYRVTASTWTVSGREVMRRARPDIPCRLAPLDHPWCVEAALRRVRPAALVLVETELWPGWIAAARRRGIPVVLVSGRLSDRSFPRYRRLGPLVRTSLRRLHAIGSRTEADRERFVALGADPARTHVTGDLKLEVDSKPPPLPAELAAMLGDLPLLVAGSTHAGEEAAALAALVEVERAGWPAALVLAPRHVERSREVEGLVRGAGRRVRVRSKPGTGPLQAGEVLLVDTLGELAPLYGHADVAFVGGSLAPVGGHNLLEPVLSQRPVLFGPHTDSVKHVAALLEACGAGRRLSEAGEFGEAALELLREPELARSRGEAGFRALAAHRGSADRAAGLVLSALRDAQA